MRTVLAIAFVAGALAAVLGLVWTAIAVAVTTATGVPGPHQWIEWSAIALASGLALFGSVAGLVLLRATRKG